MKVGVGATFQSAAAAAGAGHWAHRKLEVIDDFDGHVSIVVHDIEGPVTFIADMATARDIAAVLLKMAGDS